MESLQETMSEMMELFRNKTTAIETQLQKTSNPITLEGLAAEFASLKAFMVQALTGLQKQIEILANTTDRLEMQSRRKMLLIHGLKEVRDEKLVDSVTETLEKRLGLTDFSAICIRHCHRLGRPVDNQKCRPIAVKFCEVGTRDKIWKLKTKLKGSDITISEFLTKTRYDIFMAARKKFGLSKCWTWEGQIFVKDANEVRHRIYSINDLNNICIEENPKQAAPVKIVAPKTKRAHNKMK